MRQFHVKVYFAHIAGDGPVDAWDSAITFVRGYVVNGVYVSEDWGELVFNPFGQLRLRREVGDRIPDLLKPYLELVESIGPEDSLEDSDSEVVVIPVSRFEFHEANWFDQHELSAYTP